MKIVFTLLLLAILIIPFSVFSQDKPANDTPFRGVVMEQDSKLPLAYATIGILNKPVGTVSDSSGNFNLFIGNEYLNDTLQVSMVGYSPLKRRVRDLMNRSRSIVINLNKKVIQLNEVVVSNQFKQTEIVGRQSTGTFLQASIIPKGDKDPVIGAESGLRIQVRHYPALVDNVNFFVSANNFKYIKFRMNIYSLKNNLPDTLLFNQEVFVSIKDYKTGWVKIDLTPYHMIINRDCAITFQWVDYNSGMVKTPQMLIPAGVSFSHINYFRTAGQDKWRTIKGNTSVYVTLEE